MASPVLARQHSLINLLDIAQVVYQRHQALPTRPRVCPRCGQPSPCRALMCAARLLEHFGALPVAHDDDDHAA
ncbi:MAG TPA: hypothetical protein VJT31_24890 [Rugosimonospora sp.]|nr:hypothetical protein [Rugosimonospora sp.]